MSHSSVRVAITPRQLRELSVERFFLAFLAALRLRRIEFVDARNDAHYRRFDSVTEYLLKETALCTTIPIELYPSPYDGRYRELDDALLYLQKGASGARNPTYPGVQILMSERQAESELGKLSADTKKLIKRLADLYVGAEVPVKTCA
jgi:hypothetical protein